MRQFFGRQSAWCGVSRVLLIGAATALWSVANVAIGGPNLVANGDLEQPVMLATGRVSASGREVYFEFSGDANFGRVVLKADSVAEARQLASEFRVGYVFGESTGGRTWGLALSGKEVKGSTNYDVSIWFDLVGRIRAGAEYTYSVVPVPFGENGKIPALEMIAPAVWVDGELVGAQVSLSGFDGQVTQFGNPGGEGVVKMPDFDVQTGGQWLVLNLPRGYKEEFFLDAVSLREIDEALLDRASVRMPSPRRYVRIEDPLERRIASALSGSAKFLKGQQNEEGFWAVGDKNLNISHTATALIGLANQGEDLKSRDMRRAISWLARENWDDDAQQGSQARGSSEQEQSVLARAARLSFLARYGLPEYRQTVAEDMLWLEDAQFDDGGWGEVSAAMTEDRSAHSTNEISLIVGVALREAHYAGKEISRRTWINAAKYWTDAQARDGGFRASLSSYGGLGEATTTHMTGAGIAGLLLTLDMAFSAGSDRCDQFLTKRSQISGLDQAMEWMDVNYDDFIMQIGSLTGADTTFSGMTIMQNMLEVAGVGRFNDKDVFRTECERVLNAYSDAGVFAGSPVITANMLESLSKGAAPVVVQRVIVGGPRGAEYSRDADHLVQYMRRERGKPLNWRTTTIDRPVRELVRVPILYINVQGELDWGADKWQKIRNYCFGGGAVILNVSGAAEAQRPAVVEGLRQAMPEYTLKPLAKDDAVLSTQHKIADPGGVQVLGNGFKNFVFLPDDDWSCRMNLYQLEDHPETFQFVDNLLYYTLDYSAPPSNFAISTWEEPTASIAEVVVSRMEVGSDVPAYPDLLKTLNRSMLAGYRLKVTDAGADSSQSRMDAALLWMSATGTSPLTEGEKQAIKSYIDGGGFLFADVIGGNESAGEALRSQIQSMDPTIEIRRLLANHPIISGRVEETQGYDVRVVKLRHVLAKEFEKLPRAKMYLLERGGEEIGVLSEYDIASGQGYVFFPHCRGVMPEESRRIATNVILYAMQRKLGA